MYLLDATTLPKVVPSDPMKIKLAVKDKNKLIVSIFDFGVPVERRGENIEKEDPRRKMFFKERKFSILPFSEKKKKINDK